MIELFMKNIFLTIALVLLAVYVLPLNKINWGKVAWLPAETVTVSGEAKSVEKNQIASYTAGVEAVNDKKETAVAEVNTKVEALIKGAKDFGIKSEDIKTQNLSVYQGEETYYDNGVQKSRKGQWRVNNSVEITLRNIDQAAKLADMLTNSGATNVYGPNFSMDDTTKVETSLFDKAMKNALEKAEVVAKASGRNLGKVLTVTEGGSSGGIGPMMNMAKDGMGGGVSVEPGSSTVYKSVTVVYELK